MSFQKSKLVSLAGAFLVAVALGSTTTADTGVEIYPTNVTLNGGDVALSGGDIRDSGVTVWNSSNGQVPAASVETNPIQSGTTASDVGLGQVENEAQVAESGDTLSGSLNLSGNVITNVGSPSDGNDVATRQYVNNNDNDTNSETVCSGSKTLLGDGTCGSAGDGYLPDDPPSKNVNLNGNGFYETSFISTTANSPSSQNFNYLDLQDTGDAELTGLEQAGSNVVVKANNAVTLNSNLDGTSYACTLEENGDFSCDGAKNWVEDLNRTYEAVYSAQESPEVRAVYEGQTTTSNSVANVTLPSHFSKTVSDTRPSLRVQATPHSLATVAVTERTDDYIVIESSKDVTVDYRVTGIREGYEDKEVVRKK